MEKISDNNSKITKINTNKELTPSAKSSIRPILAPTRGITSDKLLWLRSQGEPVVSNVITSSTPTIIESKTTVQKGSVEISSINNVQSITVKNSTTTETKTKETVQRESVVNKLDNRIYPTMSKWTLSYHLNSNKSYRVSDFIKMLTVSNLKEFWELHNNLNKVNNLKDKNYYLMRDNITPTKEDPKNRNGTIISIAIPDEIMLESWIHMAATIVGEGFSKNNYLVNGICIKYINDNKQGRKGPSGGNSNGPLGNGPFGLVKIWISKLDKELTNFVKTFLKTVIPKYINKKYENHNYSIHLMNIEPEF